MSEPIFAAFLPSGWQAWPGEASDQPCCLLLGHSGEHYAGRWARELAADQEVAGLMADQFTCRYAAVDEHPALTAQLQQVLGLTAQGRGLPLLAFAAPDPVTGNWHWCGAVPFGPWRDGSKRSGVVRMAVQFLEAWQQDPGSMIAEARHLAQAPDITGDVPKPTLWLSNAEAALLEVADTIEGGFGPLPRYTQPAALSFLLARLNQPLPPSSLQQQLERSLDALIAGACHDHLAGGFFTRCDDAAWCQPAFDKTLATNAELASILLGAAARCHKPLYRQAAWHALEWCLGALEREDGWYAAGLAADSANAEGVLTPGASVLWSTAAAASVVGAKQAELFAACYLADERSELVPGWRAPTLRQAPDDERLPQTVQRLLVARLERPQPVRDERVLMSDQARLLRALSLAAASAATADDQQRWQAAADALAARIVAHYHKVLDGDDADSDGGSSLLPLAHAAWACYVYGEKGLGDRLLAVAERLQLAWYSFVDEDYDLAPAGVLACAAAAGQRGEVIERLLPQCGGILRQSPVLCLSIGCAVSVMD